MDIFDNTILCKKCKIKMEPGKVIKDGFSIRALQCPKCKSKICHPIDLQEYNRFKNLKNKVFKVKLRMVGNSYTVSIPKQIIKIINEQEKIIDNFVKLAFDNVNKLSLMFSENG